MHFTFDIKSQSAYKNKTNKYADTYIKQKYAEILKNMQIKS